MKLSSKLNPNVGTSVLLAKKDSFMLEGDETNKMFLLKNKFKIILLLDLLKRLQ